MKQIVGSLLMLMIFLGILAGYLFMDTVAAETPEEWVATVVSVEGSVEGRRAGETRWIPVEQYDKYYCKIRRSCFGATFSGT